MYGDTLITRFKDDKSDMFEYGEYDKGSNMTSDIMEVELHIRYPDNYALPWVPNIKIYVSQHMNNKCYQSIIDFDDQEYSRGRRGLKEPYREKYYDELKTCFSNIRVVNKKSQNVVWQRKNYLK